MIGPWMSIGLGDPSEGQRDGRQFLVREMSSEPILDAGEVDTTSLEEFLATLVGQHDLHPAPIGVTDEPIDETVALEAVNQPRGRTSRQDHLVGELIHPQSLIIGSRQYQKDLVPTKIEVGPGPEVSVELVGDAAMGEEHCSPGIGRLVGLDANGHRQRIRGSS